MSPRSTSLRYRAVLLDVGDTLVYAHPSSAEIMAVVCAESGLDVTVEQIEAAEGHVAPLILARQAEQGAGELPSISRENSERFWHWVYGEILGQLDTPEGLRSEIGRRFYERFSSLETWRLFPDALPALEEVGRRRRERGLILGVVSNWEDWLETLLAQLEIQHYFDFFIVSAGVRSEKPDSAIFRAALERAQTRPEETLHVGDSLHADVGGARACGIIPVLLDRRGRYSPEQTAGASIIRSLAELPALLDDGSGDWADNRGAG